MIEPDEALARAANEGDRKAFETLILRHYDRVFSLAFRLTGSKSDAEDLTQEVCSSLAAKLRSWKAESRFTTWLYRVVVNASHDMRRRKQAYQKAVDGWGNWEINRQAEIEDGNEKLAWLSHAMGTLDPELRDTAVLLVFEQLKQNEVAKILDVAEGTVSWRMSKVKDHLRKMREQELIL